MLRDNNACSITRPHPDNYNFVVAKVIFLHLSVIHSVHGGGGKGVCLSACWDTNPPGTRHPPRTRHHPPPTTEQTPPRETDSSIRSTSGRYASYWNAFLLQLSLQYYFYTRLPHLSLIIITNLYHFQYQGGWDILWMKGHEAKALLMRTVVNTPCMSLLNGPLRWLISARQSFVNEEVFWCLVSKMT